MRLFEDVLFLVILVAPRATVSLSCFQCSNIDSLHKCQTVVNCGPEQACYTRSMTVGDNLTFTMGCTEKKNCGKIPVIQTMSALTPIEQCYECCGKNVCNKKLCKPQIQEYCDDDEETDCPRLNEMFDICGDIHDAKIVCRKYCNLCSLVDGKWSPWSPWSGCDVTCGRGEHTRKRTCTNPAPANRGENCKGNGTDTKPCVRQHCPVHGGWADWSNWGECSVTCDTGIQKRFRNCTDPYPKRNGNHCFGQSMDVNVCIQGPCASVDGGWTDWGNWSGCSASCDWGMRTRSRSCSHPLPERNGRPCDGTAMQVEMCNENACSQSVVFSANYVTDLKPDNGQTIVFEKVPANQGGGYSNATGVFTTPRNGTYIFYAHMCINTRQNMHFDIMVDDVPYATAYGYTYYSCDCSSAQAVAQLGGNVSVYVQWKTWTDYQVCQMKGSSSPYYMNYFSGLLVSE